MNKIAMVAVALGLGALSACEKSPEEAQAENIEANADNAADAFEEAADNTGNEAEAEVLENIADELREGGDNIADNVVENAAD
jgi:acyl-CoA reductase-like NAD-dependent aldehyde dehydrogenase